MATLKQNAVKEVVVKMINFGASIKNLHESKVTEKDVREWVQETISMQMYNGEDVYFTDLELYTAHELASEIAELLNK